MDSKKSKKAGRNATFCKVYRLSNRREKNKVRRLDKHLKYFNNDKIAVVALENCKKKIRGY